MPDARVDLRTAAYEMDSLPTELQRMVSRILSRHHYSFLHTLSLNSREFTEKLMGVLKFRSFTNAIIQGPEEQIRCVFDEPHREKTGLPGFRPGPTQTSLYSHRRSLEA